MPRSQHRSFLLVSALTLVAIGVWGSLSRTPAVEPTRDGLLRAIIGRTYPEVPFVAADALALSMRGAETARPRLLDSRSPEEYAVSHLRGALRIDPDASDLSLAGESHGASIVVYCSVGYRSAVTGARLLRAGYRDVRNLAGGIFAWANAGRPVYRGGKPVREVHPYDSLWGQFLEPRLRSQRRLPNTTP